MKKYIKIMRIDHWVKNLFVLPGCAFAYLLTKTPIDSKVIVTFILAMIATCLIASANYVINEWLDAEFDQYHPIKKHRTVVEQGVNKTIVYVLYAALTVIGLGIAFLASKMIFQMELWLWVMGILYNVKPFRTKDIVILDVLSESVNNAIRLLIGWFVITGAYLPPISVVFGYWMGGAFLMDVKRFSEYRMINDPETASLYRKSFKHYSEKLLLCMALFYAIGSSLFVGIFLVKYRVEFILLTPFLGGLFCHYLSIAFKHDSAAQAPEKLYREKGLMAYVAVLIIVFIILLELDVPTLHNLLSNELVPIT